MSPEERKIRHNELNAAWRAKNPEYFKEWARENQAQLQEYQKKYHETVRKADPIKLKETRQRAKKNYKDKVLDVLGAVCIKCGLTDRRVLCVDHINGDGAEERRTIGYWKIMRSIIDNGAQGKYQVLCMNCNHIKRIENGEHGKGKSDCHLLSQESKQMSQLM